MAIEMNKGRTEQRESFLDVLRVTATCAVVLLHVITGVMDTADMNYFPFAKKLFLVLLDLITWCVPVFVLISGYLFLNPARKLTMKQMLVKYCRRIALALLVFGVPYACLEQVMTEGNFQISMLWNSVLLVLQGKTWSHMWYLYLILFLYLITPACKTLLSKIPRGVLYGVLAFLLLGSSVLPFIKKLLALEELIVLPDGGIYLFYYLCGYLFAVSGKGLEAKKLQKGICISIAASLIIGMICSRLIGNYTVQMAYNYPFTVVLSLLWMFLLKESEERIERKNTTFWRVAGEQCFTIYLIHPVFVNIFYKFFHVTPLSVIKNDSPLVGLSLVCFFLLVLLLAVIVTWVLRKITFLRKYVL